MTSESILILLKEKEKKMIQSVIGFFHEVDPNKSGGKGRNLVELTNASFPVPPGFILTFDVFLEYREKGRMSEEMKGLVSTYYKQLLRGAGSPFVAVRSSASAEDLKTASFAGQYDTYLYIGSEAELFQRIVDCWNSLYSQRAILYRERMNIPDKGLKMAVIVQAMIDPRAAGILFTAHSHNHNGMAMAVESGWGCGETVVSGKVTPDHYVVSREEPFKVLTRIPGKKEIVLRAGETGSIESNTTEEQRMADSLSFEELRRLCRIGREIERHFGSPQDIEWALADDGRFFIVQTRPITNINNQKL